jgi:uncharacterized protein YjbJ (UPF0337 family)
VSEGKFDDVKGRAKEAVGDITDDDDLRREGQVDLAGGSMKDKFSRAVDRVKDAISPRR